MNKIGDIKEEVRFAFLPIRLKRNGNLIWFKFYKNIFEYQLSKKRIPILNPCLTHDDLLTFIDYKWVDCEKWIRIKRELIKN